MGAPAECSQHLWSPVHAGGPVETQCPRHNDLVGVLALLPHQHRRLPQNQPYTTPGQTLCGGSALAFSTLLRQSGLRRQPNRRQRLEERPKEAAGEGGGTLGGSAWPTHLWPEAQATAAPLLDHLGHLEAVPGQTVWVCLLKTGCKIHLDCIAQWISLFSCVWIMGSTLL